MDRVVALRPGKGPFASWSPQGSEEPPGVSGSEGAGERTARQLLGGSLLLGAAALAGDENAGVNAGVNAGMRVDVEEEESSFGLAVEGEGPATQPQGALSAPATVQSTASPPGDNEHLLSSFDVSGLGGEDVQAASDITVTNSCW